MIAMTMIMITEDEEGPTVVVQKGVVQEARTGIALQALREIVQCRARDLAHVVDRTRVAVDEVILLANKLTKLRTSSSMSGQKSAKDAWTYKAVWNFVLDV